MRKRDKKDQPPLMLLPKIDFAALAAEEQPHAKILLLNLRHLRTYQSRYKYALSLFDHCDEWMSGLTTDFQSLPVVMEWKAIACRDAIFSIYHFGRSLKACETAISRCPTLRTRVDATARSLLFPRFKGAFPNYKRMRDAVGHAADLHGREANLETHGLRGTHSGRGIGFTGTRGLVSGLSGRIFSVTHERQLLDFEMSQEVLDRLGTFLETAVEVYGAIEPPEDDEATPSPQNGV